MTSEEWASGYKQGYNDATQVAFTSMRAMNKHLIEYITQVPKLRSGYSVYDGGYEDGVNQAKKLIHEFFNTPVSR